MLAIEGELEFFAPEFVKEELRRVLTAKLGYSAAEWARTLAALPIEWIEPEVYEDRLVEARAAIRDPDDAHVVALALAMGIDAVSGDKAFHPLRKPIVKVWKPREASSR